MAHDPEPTAPGIPAGGGSLRPVAVLAVGSFAMGTDSFVLAGILPNIAGGLHVSTAAAGQTITVFALTYALTAPLLAGITGALPRKPLMLAALGLFVLANLASAAAPTLALLLVARVAAGLILGAALGRPLQVVDVPPERAKAAMVDSDMPAELADAVIASMAQAGTDHAMAVLPTVEQVTGRPARSFAEWADAHLEAFR